VAPWLALLAAAATLELWSYLQQPRADHPTISSMTNALLDSHPARAAAFAGWLAATVALARR
jgi:glucose-6-phosphate dehydrogenase assembly protein OpcA